MPVPALLQIRKSMGRLWARAAAAAVRSWAQASASVQQTTSGHETSPRPCLPLRHSTPLRSVGRASQTVVAHPSVSPSSTLGPDPTPVQTPASAAAFVPVDSPARSPVTDSQTRCSRPPRRLAHAPFSHLHTTWYERQRPAQLAAGAVDRHDAQSRAAASAARRAAELRQPRASRVVVPRARARARDRSRRVPLAAAHRVSPTPHH